MPIFGKKAEKGRGFVPVEKVKALISNNVPEGQIIDILRREGFSAEEIDKAFTEVFSPKTPEPVPEIKVPEKKEVATPKPEIKPEEKKEEKKPAFAPLFIKLDKYKQILNLMAELRTTIATVKNTFVVLNELEKIKANSFKVLEKAIEKIEKKLISLDSQFLRPAGFEEEFPQEVAGMEELSDVLSSLKSQVEQLRREIQTVV